MHEEHALHSPLYSIKLIASGCFCPFWQIPNEVQTVSPELYIFHNGNLYQFLYKTYSCLPVNAIDSSTQTPFGTIEPYYPRAS